MAPFSNIIFDLDGTLTDNTSGIGNSLRFALEKMQIEGFSGDVPDAFIGPPLQEGFKRLFGLNDRNTQLAVEHFREYYASHGIFENDPYPGVYEMLEGLYFAGKKICIATAKLEKFARRICDHFGFDKYIVHLTGADYNGEKATKTIMVAGLLQTMQWDPSKAVVMVGDTVFDIRAGQDNGLSTVAVTYGFGKEADLKKAGPDILVDQVEDLYEVLR